MLQSVTSLSRARPTCSAHPSLQRSLLSNGRSAQLACSAKKTKGKGGRKGKQSVSAPAAPSASAKPAAANRSDPEPAAAPQKQADKGTAPAAAAASSSQGSQNGSSSGTDTHRAVTVNESVVGEHKAATDLSRAETVSSVATDDPAASQPATVAATTAVPPTPQDAPPKPAPLPTRQASPVVAATKAVEEPSVQPPVTLSRPRTTSSITAISRDKGGAGAGVLGLSPNLWKKIGLLVALVAASRIGVYDRLPGVDVAKFSEAVSSNGLLGYLDSITGGSISNVGVCSLGIIPAINASIFLQILTITFPGLKKLQREEGPQGRARYQLYQKLATLAFATAQAFGQLTAIKGYVTDFSPDWVASNMFALVAGAMITNQIADYITELKLGNGTSVLIFANIASYLPSSLGAAFTQAQDSGSSSIAIYLIAFLVTTFGIVCVQAAERRVPVNSASRYSAGTLAKQNYFPFKVNATGVMPVIFATSLLAAPPALVKLSGLDGASSAAQELSPGGTLYLPLTIVLIAVINRFYTFLQFEPNDISEQLKRTGTSIPGVRPGRATAAYITERFTNMAWLGSIFLCVLSCAPAVTEAITGVPALRGFAGTSVLIIVGVATDTARRIKAEKQMSKYGDIDELYDNI